MLEVLFDLLKWLWRDNCLWRDGIDLSKQSEKSAKCRPVAAKRPLVLRPETKVLHHETLVHVINIEMLAGQPLTEITHNSDTARPTLIAMPLSQQLCGIHRYAMATTSIRLDRDLIDKATIIAKALNRTPPKQIEHWAKIGEIMEDNPDLPYEFVRQAVVAEAEREAGKLESYDFG